MEEQAEQFFSDLKVALKKEAESEHLLENVKKIEGQAKKELINKYDEIAEKIAEYDDKGFKNLGGVRGMESLRGVMGKELEYDWLVQIAETQKKNT